MEHFLRIADLSGAEIMKVFELAADIKAHPGRYRSALRDRTVALIFQKPSTRTRVSFEAGIRQMGGTSLYLAPNDLQLGRGETVSDTARVLSRYVDAVVGRVYAQEDLEEMARSGTIPVINGLSDAFHPCQALADYFTLLERRGRLAGLKIAYVGDGNNVVQSLIDGGARLGVHVSIACPPGYAPDPELLRQARASARRTGARIEVLEDPRAAVKSADAVYTDVWTSMGQEAEEQKRRLIFQGYQVSERLFQRARPDALFMHCLPAHRGDEVASEVMDSPRSVVFDQAENRLYTQKAILQLLLGRAGSGPE
jgi:ornithine carbamoyltransferase